MKASLRVFTDLVGFVVGPFFAAYYLLDFSHGPAGPGPYYYYYRLNSQLGLALGVALICLGLVMRNWTKERPSQSRQLPRQEYQKRPQPNRQRPRRPKQEVRPSRPNETRGTGTANPPSKQG